MWATLEFGRYGFLLAAAGYLLFWALLLTVRVHTPQKKLLSCYAIFCVLWALSNSQTNVAPFADNLSFLLENLYKMSLAFFLLAALNKNNLSFTQLLQQPKNQLILALFFVWLVSGMTILSGLNIRLIAALLLTVTLLSLVETIYRQSAALKWQFKPLVIAFGVCLLLDFYLLAEASLLGTINQQTWQARGYVHIITLPFLVVAVKRIKSWGINVYISRDIVLQSSLVLAAGIYLCILAIVGYYLSYIGGDWTTLLQVVFVVFGFLVLSVLLFSDAIRRKTKVFIEKNFFANTFDYRIKWVELSRELKKIEIADQNAPQVCLTGWCQAIGYADGALIKFDPLTPHIDVLAKTVDMPLNATDLSILRCYQQLFQHKNWLLDFSDQKDLSVSEIMAKSAQHRANFDLLVPIQQKNVLWGCCILKPNPNEKLKLNWELRDYLNAVSEQISSYLFMSEASKTLSENAQFIAFSRMSAFVVHDLKNVKAQIDMLLKNAKKHRHNPEFVDDAFETIEAMQSRLQNMLAQLTNKQSSHDQKKKISIGKLVQQVIAERCAEQIPLPTLLIRQDSDLLIDTERFGNILYHLIDNAQQATDPKGTVALELAQTEQMLELTIKDSGCGMSEEFIRERLFKPFDTTKGNAWMGIGAYDALTFIQQQQGSLSVESKINFGSTFTIRLPLN